MKLRADLAAMVETLLAGTAAGDAIELDTIGEAIGARAITSTEIDEVMSTIERRGRRIASSEGARGEARLKIVLETARTLRAELGRAPRAEEIAERASLSRDEVNHALALARVMQR